MSGVRQQLEASSAAAAEGLVILELFLTTVINADHTKPSEELARLKREALGYQNAGVETAKRVEKEVAK